MLLNISLTLKQQRLLKPDLLYKLTNTRLFNSPWKFVKPFLSYHR
jgi:hypothetical protein